MQLIQPPHILITLPLKKIELQKLSAVSGFQRCIRLKKRELTIVITRTLYILAK